MYEQLGVRVAKFMGHLTLGLKIWVCVVQGAPWPGGLPRGMIQGVCFGVCFMVCCGGMFHNTLGAKTELSKPNKES